MEGGSCGRQGRDCAGRCPGDSAGSRALPVSGCGVRRAGGLLGGLRGEWRRGRGGERRNRQAAAATGIGAMAAGIGRAAAAPGEPNPLLRGPAAAVPPPRPLTRLPGRGAACPGERGQRSLEASAPRAPSPTAGPLAPRRAAGPLLPPGGAEPGGNWSRSPSPPRSPSRRRGWSRLLVLTRLLFPAGVDRSRLRLPSAVPDSPEARRW